VVFKTLVTTAMLIVGSFLLLNQQLNVGQFIAAEIVILTIIGSVEKIIGNLDSVYDVLTAVEKIEKITDKEIEKTGSIALTNDTDGLRVALNKVSFKYQDDPNYIFNNISFTVGANEKVCIQGTEGAGKSTLLRLMAASYDDFWGSIQINDVPIGNYQLGALRNRIGIMISQQDIFEGTLMENICMGLKDVQIEEIKLLCKKTGLSEFLAELKDGFDTALSATGRKLPGHAVKKILLIRALIHKPALLLLEEPWTGLATKHQEQIKKYLLEELQQTTIIVVTRDESFAQSCDKIIALHKDGCDVIVPNKQ
jgi:ABC-type bacteriocin/lantibiotic exporter with double-glycine peptidase domain